MQLRRNRAPLRIPVSFQPDKAEGPDLIPLLDIVFIMLIFFILAAAFAVRGMDVELPPAQSSRPLAGHILELRLDEDGALSCEGVSLTPETLGKFLRYKEEIDRQAGTPYRTLVLRAAPKAPVAALVGIVDVVKSMGGSKLVIATGQEGAPKDGENDANRRRGL